ncbi:MAG TPA: hypothetical protein VNL13_05020 [Sulfolobales archaeon]|nr:hypothetical protein [Sulfolobales archaeon]
MVVCNVYIVSYNEKSIEEVERELSRIARIVQKVRSSVVHSFYYYRIECNSEDSVNNILRNYIDKGLISWAKVEKTLG